MSPVSGILELALFCSLEIKLSITTLFKDAPLP